MQQDELLREAKHLRRLAKKLEEMAKENDPMLFDVKPKAKPGDEKNPFGILRLTWLDFFIKEKGVKYYFQAKDGAALKRIIAKIRNQKEEEMTKKEIEATFKVIIRGIRDADNWVYENLSLSIVDSKFNELVAKIKDSSGSDYTNKVKDLL